MKISSKSSIRAIDLYVQELGFISRRLDGENIEENWEYIEHQISKQRFFDETPPRS